jgi:hypothetical protein
VREVNERTEGKEVLCRWALKGEGGVRSQERDVGAPAPGRTRGQELEDGGQNLSSESRFELSVCSSADRPRTHLGRRRP